MHWAAAYVGAPYQRGADGPAAFDCWGLVRHVFRVQYRIEFPAVVVRDDDLGDANLDNVAAIKRSARVSGMRPVGSVAPADGDIVLIRSAVLHCGVVIMVNGRMSVLHAGHQVGVVVDSWRDAIKGAQVELWRISA